MANPYTYEALDAYRKVISISIGWAPTLRTIGTVTVHRDSGCLFAKILIGLGADGKPDSSSMALAVAVGDATVLGTWFTTRGLTTIDNVLARQITVGR